MKTLLGLALALGAMTIGCASTGAESALDAASKIAGTYTGQWSMYGLADGHVVEKASWTDRLEAGHSVEDHGRAYVEVTDTMTFANGQTRTSKFIEGYSAKPDGSAGDRFYEIGGTATHFKKLTERDWVYQATPDPGELWFLGVNPQDVVFASHVTTKTTTFEGPIDTDHVTRLTTIQWKDADGKIHSTQFVSMKGEHARTP